MTEEPIDLDATVESADWIKAKAHPRNCLCDDCVILVDGRLFYSDGTTPVPDADPTP
jgi:hypothetical protein